MTDTRAKLRALFEAVRPRASPEQMGLRMTEVEIPRLLGRIACRKNGYGGSRNPYPRSDDAWLSWIKGERQEAEAMMGGAGGVRAEERRRFAVRLASMA